jgi:hypothetical protein
MHDVVFRSKRMGGKVLVFVAILDYVLINTADRKLLVHAQNHKVFYGKDFSDHRRTL